jgi:hydrogenase maturation protease
VKTAVIGVGNVLMGDEGIGVKAIEALQDRDLPPGTELFDGGTAFHALTGELADFDKLIIVDAVNGGQPVGTVYRLALEEVLEGARGNKATSDRYSLSLHDVGVIEALMLEKLTERTSSARRPANGLSSAEIVIIGIEPARVELSMELSPTLSERLPALVQTVLGELRRTQPHPAATSACL